MVQVVVMDYKGGTRGIGVERKLKGGIDYQGKGKRGIKGLPDCTE
jgi:hypothetical protein